MIVINAEKKDSLDRKNKDLVDRKYLLGLVRAVAATSKKKTQK